MSDQIIQLLGKEVTDALNRHIRYRKSAEHLGVVRELALAWKYRSHALAPRLLDCCKNAHLVIHHHIVCRRILPLDIGERGSSEIR